MFEFIGPLISAGASLLGGAQSRASNDAANRMNYEMAQQNLAFQREAAQHGISWKVADARNAGLAPLAALGAQTFNPSPVSVGAIGDSSFGTGIASAGQDISRALQATRSSQDKVDAFTKATQDLTIQKMGLENELLASQVRRANQVAMPPFPTAGKQRQIVDGQAATNIVSVDGDPVKPDDLKQAHSTVPSKALIRPFGYRLRTNPYFSDAQDVEDRYGDSEVGSSIQYLVNMGADHLYSLRRYLEDRSIARDKLGGSLRRSLNKYIDERRFNRN